jgi:hypothetical protein
MKKCINGRSGVNFSLVESPAIRGILKKRSLLIGIRTVNITAIQPLYAITRRDVVFVQKIIQSCNITVEPVKLARVANTSHALIAMKAMQRTTKNATNGTEAIFGIPHNFTNWLALLLQVDFLERPSFT